MDLLICQYVDRDLQEADLQELLSSSRYSDTVKIGAMSAEELNRRCARVVDSFSRYGLFFKQPIEPWSQILQGDERLEQEKVVSTLGFQWDLEEDLIISTMEPSLASKREE